jgi:hypothetical protein
MDIRELVDNLKFEYYSIQTASPDWHKSLWDFLIGRGISPDDIWEHCPEAGREAGQTEPEWV